MARIFASSAHVSRRKPLAACVASLFALAAPTTLMAAPTWPVTSCLDDGGPTTLRGVINAGTTMSGDTVDMSGLTGVNACPGSTITLVTGAIAIPQPSLTILGPGSGTLQIDASGLSGPFGDFRAFTHAVGGGLLTIQSLGLTGGHVYHMITRSIGGCLYSEANNVVLTHVDVSYCKMNNGGGYISYGGGVYAKGNLTLNYSTVTESKASSNGDVRGGGVYAKGNLTLNNSMLSNNSAVASAGASARGGGAYAAGDLTTSHGTVSGNYATSYGGSTARGGGVYGKGVLSLQFSTVSGNAATSSTGGGSGGGVYSLGSLTLGQTTLSDNKTGGNLSSGAGAAVFGNFTSTYSAVSGNKAYGAGGQAAGLLLKGMINTIATSTISGNVSYGGTAGVSVSGGNNPGTMFQMSNSTISNNHASNSIGGLYVDSAIAKFYNSTIAFNTDNGVAPGASVGAYQHSVAVTLQSTLMSNNTNGSFANEDDLRTFGSPAPHLVTFNAAPSNTFVRVAGASGLPSDVIALEGQGLCPRLGQLRNNGGLTQTHALLSGSLAINAGNDVFGAPYDQRGSFIINGMLDYTRFSGDTALADIGAYEVQHNDIVFNNDLEGCPI